MSPVESESRIAAQLAPLLIVDSIPYFLKSPFSCAITSGEQSVSAIMPNLSDLVSGPSLAAAPGGTSIGRAELALSALVAPQPVSAEAATAPAAATKARRVNCAIGTAPPFEGRVIGAQQERGSGNRGIQNSFREAA